MTKKFLFVFFVLILLESEVVQASRDEERAPIIESTRLYKDGISMNVTILHRNGYSLPKENIHQTIYTEVIKGLKENGFEQEGKYGYVQYMCMVTVDPEFFSVKFECANGTEKLHLIKTYPVRSGVSKTIVSDILTDYRE